MEEIRSRGKQQEVTKLQSLFVKQMMTKYTLRCVTIS